jgi:hypothetical protein
MHLNLENSTLKKSQAGISAENCSPAGKDHAPNPLLDARRDSCVWKDDNQGCVSTECGEDYCLESDWKPFARYCPDCGGVVRIEGARVEEWQAIQSARFLLEDADPEKLAEACGLTSGMTENVLRNIFFDTLPGTEEN